MQQEDVNSLRIYYLDGDALFFFYYKEERTLFTFFSWLNTIICWEVWSGRRIFFDLYGDIFLLFFFFLSNFLVNLNRSVEWRFHVFVYPHSPCSIADLGAQIRIYIRQRLQHLFFNCLALVWVSVAGFHLTGAHSPVTAGIRAASVAEVLFLYQGAHRWSLERESWWKSRKLSLTAVLKTFYVYVKMILMLDCQQRFKPVYRLFCC